MNTVGFDLTDALDTTDRVNCMEWATNTTLDFDSAVTIARNRGILWDEYELDDALVDAPMMKRVWEALIYDGSSLSGYRDNGSPLPVGWHRVRVYHHNFLVIKDYHFSTEAIDVITTATLMTEKIGNGNQVSQGDDEQTVPVSTLLGTYIINTQPRWYLSNW